MEEKTVEVKTEQDMRSDERTVVDSVATATQFEVEEDLPFELDLTVETRTTESFSQDGIYIICIFVILHCNFYFYFPFSVFKTFNVSEFLAFGLAIC